MVEHVAASSPLLSADHRRQFAENGYCIVADIYAESEIVEIERFFEGYKNIGTAVFDAGSRFDEIDPTKRQLRAMHPHRYSEQARRWALNSRLVEVLGGLLGRAPLLAQTMYYFKPPGAKGQGMHQDNFYVLAEPATCIAAWTAIDAADIENGCLYVVPGSNNMDIFCPEKGSEVTWNSYGDTHIKPFPPGARAVPVPVARGSTLFFGGQLIHGSGPNRTKDRSRRTFIGHYIDEASDQVAQFYHPVLNAQGEIVTRLRVPTGGGPCDDGWLGALH